ncbi:hypothetical protein L0Z72_13660, partial [candidate division KSB1 bacterium]|nr:hypothetical protein [candidate division KSB1 bacterium]
MKAQIILLSIIFLLVGALIVKTNAQISPQIYSGLYSKETIHYQFSDELLEQLSREEQSSSGVKTILFLRDEQPHLNEIPQTNLVSHSAYFYPGTVLSWNNYFLAQDIVGTNYFFHIYAASDDTTYFKAELFIGNNLAAELTFMASSTFWGAKGGEIIGLDPDAQAGEEIVLKISHVGGGRGGIVWGQFSQDGSFILIPPYEIINPPGVTFQPDEFNVNLITGDSLKQKLIIENNGASRLWFHIAEQDQPLYRQNNLISYADQTYWYKQQPDLNADGFNDYTETKILNTFSTAEITSLGDGDIIHSIPAPNGNAEGLTWDGNYLWNADIASQMIYKLDPADGTILQSFPSPFWNIEGLAWVGTYLWASMIVNKIFKIDPATGDTVSSFRAPGNWLHGITYDGYYLWGISFVNGVIYRTDPTTNYTIINAIPAPSPRCIGLAWDGQYLWVGDIYNNQLHQLNPITGSIIRTVKSPVSNPRDLAWDGQYLWISSWQTSTIYQVDVGTTPDVSWLSEQPVYGFIQPETKQEIEIEFNSRNLTIDDYSSNLSLTSNDPANQQSKIPVCMEVRSALFSDVSSSTNLG